MRAISGIFVIGLAVMLYGGRTTWLSGGGVIMPHVSAKVVKDDPTRSPYLVLTNTGSETLVKLRSSVSRWDLQKQTPLCVELPSAKEFIVPLIGDTDQIFIFAEGYWMPASFVLKPNDGGFIAWIKSWLP